MKTKVIMIASSKGGVGKSTAALGISVQLALAGESVLLCDLDFGNACLDILAGVEDRVIYTVSDAANGRCTAKEAVITDSDTGIAGLSLMPCPAGGTVIISDKEDSDSVSAGNVADAVKKAAAEIGAGYVVIDTGAGVNPITDAASDIADTVIVVASHNPISLRAAEGTVARLSEKGHGDIRLVVNSFEAEATIKRKGPRKGLLDIIDMSKAPLAGVIPYDYSLMLYHEGVGKISATSERAFRNIAYRIMGNDVPLFEGINSIRKRRKKLYQ
ncbi:MAG: AAA family ATPase [Clostridia bacterium]|nr:AAA family ATPase [Clostridia bacterium]